METIPFERIPQQTRLFLDYLEDPIALRKYYPSAVRFHHELQPRVSKVLENHRVDRAKLCDALEASNRRFGAGKTTLENLQTLRESDCVAVVSGQQAGLLYGPTLHNLQSALGGETCRLFATTGN